MKGIRLIIAISLVLVILSCKNEQEASSISVRKVEVRQNEMGYYRLFVDSEEFYVDGAGLEFGDIPALAERGGNSFRTWRTENGQQDALEILDEAHQHGLMVLMGLEVARERHGFDYTDSAAVKKQFDYLKGEVKRLKHHPALLGWAIGNELNLGDSTLAVYDAVQELSLMIHEIDPNHPTTTTLAGIGKREVDYIKDNCTDLDFLSIQMYGDIVNLQQRIDDAGWDGPYLVTEWGATGHWEVARTEWDVAIEPTSKEKAESFLHRFEVAIKADPKTCMGSYVFLWGQKQERTPTWYGMFHENGHSSETVDVMEYLWTGSWPDNRCPSLDSIRLNGLTAYDNIKVEASSKMIAEVFASDDEKDSITYKWEIMSESTDLGYGGDFESRPKTTFSEMGTSEMEISVPEEQGAYRLFVYVSDGQPQSATANIPFLVE